MSTSQGRSTCWSVIVRAQGSGPAARHALGELMRRYERTVIGAVRAFRHPWDRSPEDLKQDFFLGMVRRDDIHKLDPARGRFRSWLYMAVRNFMLNEWEHWRRQSGGNAITAPHVFDVASAETPEHLFMRRFAARTALLAIERHREQAADKERFDRLRVFLPGAAADGAAWTAIAPEQRRALAAELGITPNYLAVQVHSLVQNHKRILRELVADTVDVDATDPENAAIVTQEMAELRALFDPPRQHTILEDP